ncbi:MAG: prephenate dehydratase [Pirellulaceae bacterium]|nr:prephenate dehydratase [Pirellulaceae bacterium]
MPRKPSQNKTDTTKEEKFLKEVEQVDKKLVDLLNRRGTLVKNFHKGEPTYFSEKGQLTKLLKRQKGPLSEKTLCAIFREITSGTRELVRQTRVAYLGPLYSYSYLAAVEKFGNSAELIPVGTIAAVFEQMNRAQADFGLVPLENSTDGRVVDTLDMFSRLPAKICAEVQLKIQHHLLGKCSQAEIQEVYSKPQALSQCRGWLSKHLPMARLIEISSTAAAAQLAAEKKGAAAIASHQAGLCYNLDIITNNIEDNPENKTRFAVICSEIQLGKKTKHDITSLMLEIPHTPGALADITSIFKRNKLNLTWIESFPKVGTDSEYRFFIEIEGHLKEMKVKRTLESLQKKAHRLEILGTYQRAEAV